MRVGVVGAGIGGLAVAVGLQQAGAEVTVLERADAVRAVGAGLSIFGNGFTALEVLGLGEAVRALGGAGVAPRAGQRTPAGRWLARTPPAAIERLAVVHRAALHRVLFDGLAAGTVQVGVEVVAVSAHGRTLTRRDGAGADRRASFDLVVAADGLRSRIRQGWPGDPGVRYAGYSAWRGVTSRPVDVLGAAGETLGRGNRFGIAPLGDGRVYWFAVARMPASTVVDDEYAVLTELFANWHAPIGELIAATPASEVFRLDIHELAGRLPSFRRGRCVLLGDAAHAMTPDLGQGGNQALEDAATLVRLIGPVAEMTGERIDAALDQYDRLRRPRTQRIARRARSVGRIAQAHSRIGAWIRDAGLRVLPVSVAERQLSAIQDWSPPAGRTALAGRTARAVTAERSG